MRSWIVPGVALIAVAAIFGAIAPATASPQPARAGLVGNGSVLGKVSGTGITAATPASLQLQWTNPSGGGFSGVLIRRARGAKAPGFKSGTLVARTGKTVTSFTDRHLAAGTKYTFALFALGRRGAHAAADTVTGTSSPLLAIRTAVLPQGTAGLAYQAALTATGGVPPYQWKGAGLPAGLSLAADGVIRGFPATAGTRKFTITVTDAEHGSRSAVLALRVPAALPARCAAKSCALLSRDGHTVQVPAWDIAGVTRDPATKRVTQVALTGITVTRRQVLVLAPASGILSGLVAVARTVTNNGNGTATVGVTPATPADAYDRGTVQALPRATSGTVTVPYLAGANARRPASGTRRTDRADLSCSGKVTSDLHGLSITHMLTPALAAIWKHPYFGGGGVYAGSGGLSLFQFDLDGAISLNMGIAVSGAATCTLTLPELDATVPAGDLGAVIFSTTPSLTFTVTGAIDIRSTVTLSCGAEYRWDNGAQSRLAYCVPSSTPLQLTAATGLDATLKGTLRASITLDDVAGIMGDVWAQLHAGYHPAAHPVGELDASAGYDLFACLACFWSGSPATVRIGRGRFLSQVLATYDRPPPAVPASWGKAIQVPGLAALNQGGSAVVTSISCPSSGNCSAGGQYTTAKNEDAAFVVSEVNGVWGKAQEILGTLGNGGINSISCASAGNCSAGGENFPKAFVVSEVHGTWSKAEVVPGAAAAGINQSSVYSLSCGSPGNCIAGGFYQNDGGSANQAFVVSQTGGTWGRLTEVPGTGALNTGRDASVISVSCGSAGNCSAGGQYQTAASTQVFVVSQAGGTWGKAIEAPGTAALNTSGYAVLNSVSCAAAGNCSAVGDTAQDAFVVSQIHGTWHTAIKVHGIPSGGPWLASVSCASPGNCSAGGYYANADVTAPFVVNETDGTWGTATNVPGTTGTGDKVTTISCGSAGNCSAGGTSTSNQTFVVNETNGTWDTATMVRGLGTGGSMLWSVSCPPTAGNCAAGGSYANSSGKSEAFVITEYSG
jgi:hypothetical protein